MTCSVSLTSPYKDLWNVNMWCLLSKVVSHTVTLACQSHCDTGMSITLWHRHVNHTVTPARQSHCDTGTSIILWHRHVSHTDTGMSITLWHRHVNHTVTPACQPHRDTGMSTTLWHRHVNHNVTPACQSHCDTGMSRCVQLFVLNVFVSYYIFLVLCCCFTFWSVAYRNYIIFQIVF